jgi:hypothetical protein
MNINELDTVVFAGGGTRGLAYVGTLMAFQDVYHKTIGSHFKTFVGTSVGALFALVCLLDIDVTAALDVFESIGLEKIFDRDVTWLLTNFALNNGETLRGLILQFLSMKGLGPVKANEIHVDTKTIIVHGYRSAIVRFSSKESLLTILDLPQKYFVDNPSRETLQWLPTYLVKLRALIQSKTNL